MKFIEYIKFNKYATLFILIMLQINTIYLLSVTNQEAEFLEGYHTYDFMMQNSNMGKTFYFAIPQNDIKSGLEEETIAIYVCSFTDTKVKLKYPCLGVERIKEVKAFKPTIFSNATNDVSFNWEITESEVIGSEAIILTADDPVSVYVLNSRNISSDGFLVLPTSSWGKKYIHSAYYDHYESWPTLIKRGGGFIIIAAHDGTNIEINLNGVGENISTTVGGKKIGEKINVTLKTGQTYMVQGNGSNIGFDITGTTIESSKPIGVISYHQRTMVPNKCPNGKDHLSEMLLPVESWGKEFISMEFNRGGQGDFFRIVASEDNTRIIADQYFPGSGNPIPDGHIETVINKGQFWEYLQTSCGNDNRQNGVKGVTSWKSDKPIQLMQIAYSFPWDNDRDWDPLMILVPPIKQYQRSAVIMPSVDAGFETNELTFFAIGDADDPERKLLNTIEFDNEKLSKNYQQFLYNNVSNTNIFWGRINIDQNVHSIKSKTKVSGYINGFSGYNSYGWPAMIGTNKIDVLDTVPPNITKLELECGNYKINCSEQTNYFGGVNEQKDQGLRSINYIKQASFNYSMTLEKPEKFQPELFITNQSFFLNVSDKTKDAKAYFIVGDRAGNFIVDSLIYIATKPIYNNKEINFTNKRLFKKHTYSFKIKNNGSEIINISEIRTKKNIRFTVEPNGSTYLKPEFILPYDSANINISYTPISENTDVDSLFISTNCNIIALPLKGNGVYPKIQNTNWTDAYEEVYRTVCYEHIFGTGLKISNIGTDTLNITEIIKPELPFLISEPTYPELPFKIPPKGFVHFESLCFSPIDTGNFDTKLIFISDDKLSDSLVILKGKAFSKVAVESDYSGIFNVIPNPASTDIINITFKSDEFAQNKIQIFDALGKMYYELITNPIFNNENSIPINIEKYPNGLYYIVCSSRTEKTFIKLMVNK